MGLTNLYIGYRGIWAWSLTQKWIYTFLDIGDPWNHSLNWHSNGTDDDDYVNLYFILKIKWNIGQLSRQDWLRKVIVCIWDLSCASLLSGPNLIKFKCSLTCIFFFFFFKFLLIGDIVNYLFQQYGKGRSPSTGLLERYGHQKLSH